MRTQARRIKSLQSALALALGRPDKVKRGVTLDDLAFECHAIGIPVRIVDSPREQKRNLPHPTSNMRG